MAMSILIFVLLYMLHRGAMLHVREAIGETTFSVIAFFIYITLVIVAGVIIVQFCELNMTNIPVRFVKA